MKLQKILSRIITIGIIMLITGVPLIVRTSEYSHKLLFMQVVVGLILTVLGIKIFVQKYVTSSNTFRTASKKFTFSNPYFVPIFIYIIMLGISYFTSEYKEISYLVLTKKLTFLSTFFISIGVINSKNHFYNFKNKFFKFWIITATTVSIYGILQYLGWDIFGLYKDWYKGCYRIFSTLGNPNFLAGYLAISFSIFLGFLFATDRIITKVFLSVIGTFMLLCLFLTYSRSGYLGLIFSVLCFSFFKTKNKWRRLSKFVKLKNNKNIVFLVIFLVICSITIFLLLNPYILYKVKSVVNRSTARVYIWKGTLKMILDHPIKGYGVGTFVVNFLDYRPQELLTYHPSHIAYISHPHNYFLSTWIEMGVLGFLSFLLIVFSTIYIGIKNIKKAVHEKKIMAISLLSSFIAILVINVVNVNMHYTCGGMFFWLLIGLIFSQYKFKKKGVDKKTAIIYPIFFILFGGFLLFIAFTSLPYSKEKINGRNFVYSSKGKKILHASKTSSILNKGIKNFSKKRWDKACRNLERVIGAGIKSPKVYNMLAISYFYSGKYEHSIKTFKSIKKLLNNPENIYYNLGIAYMRIGRFKKAIKYMRKVIEINPKNYKAKYIFYKFSV